MSKKITEIEGIGPAMSAKLETADITSVEGLLKAGAEAKGRAAIAATTGIEASKILTWVNMADLFRIKGIGEEYSDLLVAAGVDTVPELAQRNAANLHAKLAEINEIKTLVRVLPGVSSVEGWVEQAKALPKVITY